MLQGGPRRSGSVAGKSHDAAGVLRHPAHVLSSVAGVYAPARATSEHALGVQKHHHTPHPVHRRESISQFSWSDLFIRLRRCRARVVQSYSPGGASMCMLCQQSQAFTRQLMQHQNMHLAFKNSTAHPTQYAALNHQRLLITDISYICWHTRAFSFICVSVCIHFKRKTAWAICTKVILSLWDQWTSYSAQRHTTTVCASVGTLRCSLV